MLKSTAHLKFKTCTYIVKIISNLYLCYNIDITFIAMHFVFWVVF